VISGSFFAFAVFVDVTGDEAFARAGFSQDENCSVLHGYFFHLT